MRTCKRLIVVILVIVRSVTALVGQGAHWPDLATYEAAPFDLEEVMTDDALRAAAGELELYARKQALYVEVGTGSAWTHENGERLCRFLVRSPGALAMELLLEEVEVPVGATLRLLDLDGRELTPAIPLSLPHEIQESSTPMVLADVVVVEYRQPQNAPFVGHFVINGLAHTYRFLDQGQREGACHVNVTCQPESAGWEDVIRATVRISVVTAEGNGWCSGTLVNNVRQDCAPYILSAFHCGRTSSAAQFNQYKFYFNFQYATCSGGAYSTAQFMTGAQRVAYSDDYAPQFQGLGGSDFMLLRLNAPVPESFDPYWAGWDAANISSVSADGVCIHHPTGAPKRISTYTQTLSTGHPMASSGLMSHYKAKWAPTTNGWGVTENGSSGSGLFKPDGTLGPVLIGTLTGSSAGMTCTNNTGTAYFGKMSYHWTNNPNTAALKLKPWLDPDNTATLILAGSDDPCAAGVGVHEEQVGTPILFPNPTNGPLSFRDFSPDMAQWSITDGLGKRVLSGMNRGQGPIDVSALPAGLYTLHLNMYGTTFSRSTFVVQR